MAGQTIQVSVLADTRQFSQAFRDLGEKSGLSTLGRGVRNLGRVVAVGAGIAAAGIGAFGVQAVRSASDLEQSIGGVDAVFKDQAGTIHAWAQSAAQDVGLSRSAYNDFATVIGSQLSNLGVPMDQVTGQTSDMITMGADLAAQFGGSTSDAVSALSSLFRGESDPIERYGVSIKQSDVNARLAAQGLDGLTGEALRQAEAQARLELLTEQTTSAQGAFGRESNTLAGQQARLSAQFESVKATLGTFLLPVLTAVTKWVSDRMGPALDSLTTWITSTGVPAFQTFAAWFRDEILPVLQQLGEFVTGTVVPALVSFGEWIIGTGIPALSDLLGWMLQNKDVLLTIATAVLAGVVAFKAYSAIMGVIKAVKVAATAAQMAYNAALLANPIGIIIALIAALVAGLIYFFTQTETGRRIWTTAWNAIKAAFNTAKSAITGGIDAIIGFFTRLFNAVKTGVPDAIGKLRTGFSDGVNDVVRFMRELPGKITGAIGDLGNLLRSAGGDVIQGFLNGITAGFRRVRDKLAELTNLLPDWKGPARRDRTILRDAGQLVIRGFTDGMESQFGTVRRTLRHLTDDIAHTDMGSLQMNGGVALTLAAAGRTGTLPAAAPTYNINVQALAPNAEIGRSVVAAIRDYERLNGVRAS